VHLIGFYYKGEKVIKNTNKCMFILWI